jgi:hypothetical protein
MIDFAKVSEQVGRKGIIVVRPSRDDINDHPWKIHLVGFQKGQLLSRDVSLDQNRAKRLAVVMMGYPCPQICRVILQRLGHPRGHLIHIVNVLWNKGNLKRGPVVYEDFSVTIKDHPTCCWDSSNSNPVVLCQLREFLTLDDLQMINPSKEQNEKHRKSDENVSVPPPQVLNIV